MKKQVIYNNIYTNDIVFFIESPIFCFQYEIDEITFSADERQVIYSNIYTNEIVFFDHKAESKVKAIKGRFATECNICIKH